MAEIHEAVIRKIRQLPPLPLAAQKLLQMVEDERSSASDLTRALKTDPALAAKVLHLSNSAFYGFSGKITTLSRAVVILGFSAVKNMAIGFATCDALRTLEGPVDWDSYWLHCVTTASCGQAVAEKICYPVPEEAFIACLLHDVGYAVISAAQPKKAFAPSPDILGDIERESAEFGISHAEAGQLVMEHWKIPQTLCRTIRYHHNMHALDAVGAETLLQLVIFSDLYAYLSGCSYLDQLPPYRYEVLLQRLGVLTDDFAALFRNIDGRIAATRNFFGLPQLHPNNQGRQIILISADRSRAHWLETVISGWGFELLHESLLSGLVAQPEAANLRVLLDCGSLQRAPMEQLATSLRQRGIRICRIAPEGMLPVAAEATCPQLPHTFTRPELEHQF